MTKKNRKTKKTTTRDRRYVVTIDDGRRFFTRSRIWTRDRALAWSWTKVEADKLVRDLRPIVGSTVRREVVSTTSKKSSTFTIEMGQAYRDVLPKTVREIGGRVWWRRLDSSTTLVYVRATFYGKTSRDVQDALWERFPMASVGVFETIPEDADAYSLPGRY